MKRFAPRVLLAMALGLPSVSAWADLALAQSKNCMSCHNIDKKVVGPSYKEIAAKYKGDKAAPARMASRIREGGGGTWGVVKMPSNPQLSEADANKLALWVLSQ